MFRRRRKSRGDAQDNGRCETNIGAINLEPALIVFVRVREIFIAPANNRFDARARLIIPGGAYGGCAERESSRHIWPAPLSVSRL